MMQIMIQILHVSHGKKKKNIKKVQSKRLGISKIQLSKTGLIYLN
jgi:hypothetical protein